MFTTTLIRVLTMLAFAFPGFLFIKTKAIKPEAIPAFAKVLVYVCSPSLALYSFSRATYTPELNKLMLICFGAALFLTLAFLVVFRILLKKHREDPRWRVFAVATGLGNVGFFGMPLLEQLLGDYPDVFVFSAIMSLTMNIVVWTVGMFVLSGDRSFMRPKKIITAPCVIAVLIAYPMFLWGWSFPAVVNDAVELLGRMSTPLCMLILGMRLATVEIKTLISDWRSLLASMIKLTAFPLAMLGIMTVLPAPGYIKAAMFLLACCPCASMVLSVAEIIGKGQKSAANTILIATLLSVITIPVMAQLFLSFVL